jgi:hypothetical protein
MTNLSAAEIPAACAAGENPIQGARALAKTGADHMQRRAARHDDRLMLREL